MFEFTFLDFLKTFLGLFLIIAGRYFFVSGVFFWYLWKKKHPFQPLQKLEPVPERVRCKCLQFAGELSVGAGRG